MGRAAHGWKEGREAGREKRGGEGEEEEEEVEKSPGGGGEMSQPLLERVLAWTSTFSL